jgi:uncharacterized repeat protein (TIGR01451 family)
MKRGLGRAAAATAATAALFVGGVTTAFATLARDTTTRAAFDVPAGNLLTNSDAEAGEGSTVLPEGSVVAIPGWQTTSNFTVIKYGVGGFPSADAGAEISGGANFFGGGPANAESSASQTIDLAGSSGEIDTGAVKATLAAHMGGYLTQGDKGPVDAVFLGAADEELGRLTLAPVFPPERKSETRLIKREAAGDVPKGTRSVRVVMTAQRQTGSSNDTYFDNLSFTLTAEPAATTGTTETTGTTGTTDDEDNAPPEAVDDFLEVAAGDSGRLDVLENDSDPDGDPLSVTQVSDPANGTVDCDGGNCLYRPDEGFSGEDSFTYEITDGQGGLAQATVFVTVTSADAEPVDLSVRMTDSPDPVDAGAELTYSIEVVNQDAAAATGVEISDPLPNTVEFVTASDTCRVAERLVTCELGTISAEESKGVEVVVRPTEPGEIVNRATVTSTEPDYDPGDNEATARTQVRSDDPPPAGDLGGAVIIGGDDLTQHGCVDDAGEPIEGWLYMEKALASISPRVSSGNDGSIAALGSAATEEISCGDAGSAIGVAAREAGLPVTYYNGEDAIRRFFTELDEGTAKPRIVWIAGDGASNDLGDGPDNEPAALSDNATKLADFVNAGGGLMSHGSEFGWLFALLPNLEAVDDGSSDDLELTPEGAAAFPGLTNEDINAGPWHNFFQGDFGGLEVLVKSTEINDSSGNDAAVIVGGAAVQLPGSIVLEPGTATNPVGTSHTVTATVRNSDGTPHPGVEVSFEVTDGPNGETNGKATTDEKGQASFTYTGNGGPGTDTIEASFVDDTQTTRRATATKVWEAAANRPPSAADDVLNTAEDTAKPFNALANDTDPDGDALSVTGATSPSNGSVTCAANGDCTYTPSANYSGPDAFSYTISDGKGGTDTATVDVTVVPVNDEPNAVDDSLTTAEDTPETLNVLTNDEDVEGGLHVTAWTNGELGSVSCEPEGACTYTPRANVFGTDSFTYTIEDDTESSDTATVHVTINSVNDPPVAVDDPLVTDEDTAKTINVLGNDSDPDEDTLTVTGESDGERGTAACLANGDCTYTPEANYSGPDSFTYDVSDGHGGTATATVNVTVNEVNHLPVAVDDPLVTDEDTAKTINVLGNDSDPDEDTLTVTGESDGEHGTAACLANGDCTYTPEAGYSGADSFTYDISDGHGGTARATVNVTVNEVNHLPVAVDDPLVTDEDTAKTINVLGNDSDPDEDTLTVTGESDGEHGTAACLANGDCTYTPEANYSGPDSFTYDVSDGHGGTATAKVDVTVIGVNDPPNAVDDPLETAEDANGIVNVLANDTDPDGEDELTVTGSTNGAHGTVVCTAAGACTYTPAANYNGPDAFTYTVADEAGETDTATVDVTVTAVNDPPVAVVDALATTQGNPATLNVLTNDTDLDGDALSTTGSSDGAHGSVVCTAAGACTYTPNAAYSGPDSFTYTVSDGHGGTDTGTVGVLVAAAASPPPPPPPPSPPPAAPPTTGLVFTTTVSPDQPAIGDVVSYTTRIDNRGAAPVNGVTFVHEVPESATFVSAEASQGSCSGTRTIVCGLGTVEHAAAGAAGAFNASSVTVVHRVRFTQAGDASSTATLEGANAVGSRQTTSVSILATPPLPRVAGVDPPPDDGIPNANQTVVLEPVSGEILVRLPGTDQFVPLSALRELPNGTEVDAREGRLRMTVATLGGTASSDFFDGIFTVSQQAPANVRAAGAADPGVTELRLTRGDFSTCTAKPAAVKSKKKAKKTKKRKPAAVEAKPRKPIRRLWGNGEGSFRTRGRYSAATVRGTIWLTEDYCNGTLVRVQEGAVTVRDLVKNRTVNVTAGKSYFAEVPAPKAAKAKAKPKKKATKKRKPAAGR